MKISRRGMTSWLSKYRGPELRLLSHASSVLSLSKGPQSKYCTGWERKRRKEKKNQKKNQSCELVAAPGVLARSCFLGKGPSGAHAEPAGPARRRWPSHEGWWQPRRGARAWRCFPFAHQPLAFHWQQGRERGTSPVGAEDVTFWLPVRRRVSVPFSLPLLLLRYLHSTASKCLRARGKRWLLLLLLKTRAVIHATPSLSACVRGGGAGVTPGGYGLWKSSAELNLIETDDL